MPWSLRELVFARSSSCCRTLACVCAAGISYESDPFVSHDRENARPISPTRTWPSTSGPPRARAAPYESPSTRARRCRSAAISQSPLTSRARRASHHHHLRRGRPHDDELRRLDGCIGERDTTSATSNEARTRRHRRSTSPTRPTVEQPDRRRPAPSAELSRPRPQRRRRSLVRAALAIAVDGVSLAFADWDGIAATLHARADVALVRGDLAEWQRDAR
mmetsp:Transcript_11150/g.33440  ORF Transcript_11150/g.33440 Transcript_11150/m.33440 type:complete len:219 (+) Transcript_11150:278-934(+)